MRAVSCGDAVTPVTWIDKPSSGSASGARIATWPRRSRRLECLTGISWSSRGLGVLRSPYGAHRNRSCWDDLCEGPACRCSNFFVGNFVAAPDIAQNPAAPPRSLFARYPALRTPAALRRRPRHAHRRFRAAQLVVVTVYAHAPAPRRTRTKVAGRKTADGARNLGEKERALFNARDRFT